MFTGYQAPGAMVGEALSRMGIDPSNMQLLREHLRRWTPADLHRLVAHFLRVRFPMLLALNKVRLAGKKADERIADYLDLPAQVDVNDRHIERLKATFPHDTCVPMSARAEWSLCQWRRRGRSWVGRCFIARTSQRFLLHRPGGVQLCHRRL